MTLHPVFVHFTIALLFVSAVLAVTAGLAADKPWSATARAAARWNFAIGLGLTILTAAAGFYEYFTVDHDTPSHLAMTGHRNIALITVTGFLALGVWVWRAGGEKTFRSPVFITALSLAAALLGFTGYLGGELVYRHGLGVASLPAAEGVGHSHSHDGEEADSHDEETHAAAGDHPAAEPDSAEAALNAFHAALKAGDGERALGFLAPDVLILESGGAERSRDEYAGHHLGSDMAFLKNMTDTLINRELLQLDNRAVILSTGLTQGTFRGEDIKLSTAETAILEKRGNRWIITHLHWSSRA